MKYLKYILGVIVVLAIGFFLMGIVKSEISYDCEVLVDKPVAESWSVVQDPDKLGDWLEGYQKTEHVSGTPGAVGSVSNVYFIEDEKEVVIKETITEIDPNESISMTFENDFMNMDYKMSISENDGKSTIKSRTTAVGNDAISKSIMAMMGGAFVEQEETNLGNLKKVIEENTK